LYGDVRSSARARGSRGFYGRKGIRRERKRGRERRGKGARERGEGRSKGRRIAPWLLRDRRP